MQQHNEDSGFLRHVRACNNWQPPGDRFPLRINEQIVGWVSSAVHAALAPMDEIAVTRDGVQLLQPQALPQIARRLADQGIVRWRNEAFDVRASADGPALTTIDRGSLPGFGVQATGVHVNGLVRRHDGLHVWVARRSRHKQLDPGKLDHVVAGGVSAGMGTRDTLVKEAAEEAGIPAELTMPAREVATLRYAMERPEGLRRDCLVCYDLDLPQDFVPRPMDGEAEGFELWSMADAARAVRDTNDFKFNVNLVLIDLFLRNGLINEAARGPLAAALYAR